MSYMAYNSSNWTHFQERSSFDSWSQSNLSSEMIISCISAITLLICVFGFLGTMFTAHFFRRAKTAETTKRFMMMLAIYDALSLSLIAANSIVNLIIIEYDKISGLNILFSKYFIPTYVSRMPQNSSNMMLLVIAVERMNSIIKPHKVKTYLTKNVGTALIVTISLLVPTIMMPLAFEYEEENIYVPYLRRTLTTQTLSNFGQNRAIFKGLQITIFTLFFCVPLCGVVVCNAVLIKALLKKGNFKKTFNTSRQDKEIKTTKLVLGVTIIFVISVTPLGIFIPLSGLVDNKMNIDGEVFGTLIPLSNFFESINYSSNFIVYYIGSPIFRKQFQNLFSKVVCCLSKIQRQVGPAQNDNCNINQSPHEPNATSSQTMKLASKSDTHDLTVC